MGDEVLIDHLAVAARLADFDADGAVNLQPLWVDTRSDFDWREPGDFALMLFDFKAGPNRACFYPRVWRGLGAKGSEESVVGRVDEVDFGRLRTAGRLSDGIRMLTGGDASGDRENRRLVGSCRRKAGRDRGGLAGVGRVAELAELARQAEGVEIWILSGAPGRGP